MSTATAATPTRARTINGLKPGESVRLRFDGSRLVGNQTYIETHIFLGFTGEGEDREARFCEDRVDGAEWEAYRHRNRWSYGPGAETLHIDKD